MALSAKLLVHGISMIVFLLPCWCGVQHSGAGLYIAYGTNLHDKGEISASSDQGKTWTSTILQDLVPTMVSCLNVSHCYLIAQNVANLQVFASTDTGKSWRVLAKFMNPAPVPARTGSLSCFTPNKCVFTLNDMLGSTKDGFKSLQISRPSKLNESRTLTRVTCISPTVCIATKKTHSRGSILLHNIHWGDHWVTMLATSSGFQDVSCVQAVDKRRTWVFCMAVVETESVYVSYDSALTWKRVVYSPGGNFPVVVATPGVDYVPLLETVSCPRPELCVLGFRAHRVNTSAGVLAIPGALCTIKITSGRGELKCRTLAHDTFDLSVHCVTPHECLALSSKCSQYNTQCCPSQLHHLDVSGRVWSPPFDGPFGGPVPGWYPRLSGSKRGFTSEDAKTVKYVTVTNRVGRHDAIFALVLFLCILHHV